MQQKTRSIYFFANVTDFSKRYLSFLYFQRPVPAESWSETLNAVRFGSVCPQALFFPYTQPIFQSEDCLTLNVFVPYEVRHSHLK